MSFKIVFLKQSLSFFLACNQVLDESQVTLSFQEWLASVTERIHQAMHYQFDGKLEGTQADLSGFLEWLSISKDYAYKRESSCIDFG